MRAFVWRERVIGGIIGTSTAGRPALHGSEPGQVRKEAATAISCKCRGNGSPPNNSSHMKNIRLAYAGLLVTALLAAGPARAIDGISAEAGRGDDVNMGRLGVQWDWQARWFQGKSWHLGGYWDAAIGYWHQSDVGPGQHSSIVDLGLTPVFRIQPNGLVGPFVEAAIGFHLLSHSSIGGRRMSTAFQFGDHIGVGYRFGAKQSVEVAYRFQHLSNGSVKRPNPGINFNQIRVQYHW